MWLNRISIRRVDSSPHRFRGARSQRASPADPGGRLARLTWPGTPIPVRCRGTCSKIGRYRASALIQQRDEVVVTLAPSTSGCPMTSPLTRLVVPRADIRRDAPGHLHPRAAAEAVWGISACMDVLRTEANATSYSGRIGFSRTSGSSRCGAQLGKASVRRLRHVSSAAVSACHRPRVLTHALSQSTRLPAPHASARSDGKYTRQQLFVVYRTTTTALNGFYPHCRTDRSPSGDADPQVLTPTRWKRSLWNHHHY